MPIGALPHLGDVCRAVLPSADPITYTGRSLQGERRPGERSSRVLKYAAPAPHGLKGSRETTTVVAGTVLRFAVAPKVHAGHVHPELTRRMRHNRPRSRVQPRVPLFVPRVDVGQAEIASAGLDVESGDLHCERHSLQNTASKRLSASLAASSRDRSGNSVPSDSHQRSHAASAAAMAAARSGDLMNPPQRLAS